MAGVLVGAGVLASWYARPVVQARMIGIAWRATLRRAYCTRTPSEVFCTTEGPRDRAWPHYPTTSTTVAFTPTSRRLIQADRSWYLTDSAPWQSLIDSTRRALAVAHRDRLPCDTVETGFPIAEATLAGSSQEIRLYAMPASAAHPQAPWYATVRLVSLGAAGCGPRIVRRLLTPAELGRAMRAWFADRFGF